METSGQQLLFPTNTPISIVFFWIGFVFGLSSTLLIIGAIIGLCWRSAPRSYRRAIEIMATIQLVTSTLIAGAYIAEILIAFSSNRYGFFTVLHLRFGAYPLNIFALVYWLSVFAILTPQLFWWKRFRRSFPAVLLVALATSFGIWYEPLVVFITRHAEYLPAS